LAIWVFENWNCWITSGRGRRGEGADESLTKKLGKVQVGGGRGVGLSFAGTFSCTFWTLICLVERRSRACAFTFGLHKR
jgi:hypothetical protein